MATPNKVDDFIPYRLLLYVEARLNLIATAAGYNTDPFVTTDWAKAENSEAKHTLWLETSGANPSAHFVGGGDAPRLNEVLSFDIIGVSKFETEDARRLAMSLEQDCRTAVHSGVGDIRTSIGRGCSFRFISCTPDGGVLAPNKEAGFRLTCSFSWSQNSDW